MICLYFYAESSLYKRKLKQISLDLCFVHLRIITLRGRNLGTREFWPADLSGIFSTKLLYLRDLKKSLMKIECTFNSNHNVTNVTMR